MPGVQSHSAAQSLAIGHGAVWVGFHREPYVVRIDPSTNRVVATVRTPARDCGLGIGDGRLWAAHCASAPGAQDTGLSRIDASSNRLVTTLRTPSTFSPTFGGGSLWVIAGQPEAALEAWRIEAGTDDVSAKIALGGEAFTTAFGFGSLWVAYVDGSGVARIDATTNTVTARIATGSGPLMAVAADEGAVWALPAEEARIYRIDPATNTAASYALPAAPGGYFAQGSLAVAGGSVWARTGDTRIARLDAQSGRMLGTIYVGAYVGGLAWGFGSLWAAVPDLNQVWRITPR